MITGVVLARNEEANIVGCLEALRPHVAELLLIDMESGDRTIELGRPLVDNVLSHPRVPNFDAARNIAIDAARHDWLWFIDADERVPEVTGRMVNDLVREQGNQFEAISIPFKSYFCGQWMQHCGWWPGYTMPRVLKRGHFRFAERLHGGVELNGREVRLPPDPALGIDHYSYTSVEHYLEKFNRYTSTEAGQLAKEQRRWDWRQALAEMTRDLFTYYEANPGRLDGARGFILSWLSGLYRFVSNAKLIDHENGDGKQHDPTAEAPADLDEVLWFLEDQLAMLRAQRPVPPLGIVLRTPVWDPSGYADEGRTFAKALAIGNRPLLLGEIRWSDQQCEVPAADAALFRALQRSRRARYVAAITECIPTLVQPDARASLNILRTTHETDRIPDGWLPHIQQYDEVWVFAQHNANAFRRSGVAPERMRVVNSCIDTSVYRPDGYALPLPAELANGFVFLSVFDWQLRKGWDLLLEAYCQEFAADDKVGLLLKISHVHGFTFDDVRHQADELLKQFGQSLADRPDIVMCNQTLSSIEVASLYRAVDAFVLPSRGEGWGRPYMEAMASGLPVIGTSASGNVDFMNESNSFLIPVQQVDVTEAAAAEIPPYRGHRWFEPDVEKLRKLMRRVVRQRRKAKRIGEKAAADIRARFDLSAGREAIETALAAAEERFVYVAPPPVRPDQSKVVWEGEFFASHSFSNINEQLALRLGSDEEMALSIDRRMYNPAFDRRVAHAHRLVRYFGRPLEGGPQVTVRHSFPPNLTPPASGAWIHIQPWEYGHLPVDWIGPLRDQVDEVWAPSNYVRTVYERSGFPREKIQVIPWGVDESVFRPDVPALILPTDKSFKFLFVGGTIPRKGIDVLLETYLTEFTPDDDVCLVIKDLGVETFYRYDHARDQIRAAMNDPSKARIVYIDRDMTPGQLASLYAACDCLAAPYRGEGFGLPILEAMACGVPAIVPRGGASDDFVSDETAFRVRSCEVETEHSWTLAGPCLELAIDLHELRQAMREAYEQRDKTAAKGQAASDFVREQFTWARTVAAMKERIRVVAATVKPARRVEPVAAPALPFDGQVALLVAVKNAERELAACLGRVKAFVDEIIVVDRGSKDSSAVIAEEYGARVIDGRKFRGKAEATKAGEEAVQSRWAFWLSPADILAEREARGLRDITRQQADSIAQVHVQLKASKVEAAQKNGGALRLFRRPKREVPVDSGPRYA